MTTPSETKPEPTRFAVFVALDWADQKHAYALQAADARKTEHGLLENTPEAVEQWAAELARRFGGRPIALALEQPRGAVVAVLGKYAHLVLHPVHPNMLANYRMSFYPSGAKSDPSDADLLLELLCRHRDRLKPLQPDTGETRSLQFLSEERRKEVDEKTRLSNRLTDWLKRIFPQILKWFDDVDSPLVCALLSRWPTLQELQKAREKTLRDFFHQHNCRNEEPIDQRIEAIRQAVVATQDGALLKAGVLTVQNLTGLIARLREDIGRYDEEIERIAKAHPDFAIFASLPGAGVVLVPRLIAALGTDRDRFPSAVDLQCFTRIAPVLESSGKQSWVHWRWACPRFIRQSVHEWAQHSIPHCEWAREFYQAQKAKGKSHHAAIRALAYKWLRILYRCWKDRKPYDESIYLAARQKRAPAPA